MRTQSDISALVRPGYLDGRIYSDPEIFDLEMERIFYRAWIYVGHESQAKLPGDFFRARIGLKNIFVTRDDDNRIHAFHNRCTHRGTMICAPAKGNSKRFTCPYHAWTFNNKGELISVPHRRGYEPDFAARSATELGLKEIPRLASYKGFIFGSLTSEGEGLVAFLGPDMCLALDNFIDRSPTGEIEVTEGKLIQTYKANWKLQLENSIDLVHPPVLHQNAVEVASDNIKRLGSRRDAPVAFEVWQSNGIPHDKWDDIPIYALRNGHCYMQGFLQKFDDPGHLPVESEFGSDDQMQFSGQEEYKAALVERHGRANAEAILGFNRHNTIIYPNMLVNPRLQQVRVLQPKAPDHTEQHCYVFRLKGAPEAALETAVAFLTANNSPSNIVTSDDQEILERIQQGVSAPDSVIDFTRELGRQQKCGDHWTAVGTSELAMRNQHAAWLAYMSRQ